MRRPPLSDLEQVDPSLLTKEAVGHNNPEETSKKTAWTQAATAVVAPAPGGNQIALVEGGQRQERALLYCATGSPSEPWAGKRGEAEPGCVGAGCALR